MLTDLGAEDEAAATVSSPGDALLAEMAPYEVYILGMLTNYPSLPLDRIHAMLR